MYLDYSSSPISLENLQSLAPLFPPKIGLFINGECHDLKSLINKINEYVHIILVDGGANTFSNIMEICEKEERLKLNCTPVAIIGDLDSATENSLSKIQKAYGEIFTIKLCRYKDFTDLEAALALVNTETTPHLTIFNGFGGRVDQMLGNILYLFRTPYQGRVSMSGESNELLLSISREKPFILENKKGMYLTVIPLYGRGTNITLTPPQPQKGDEEVPSFLIQDVYVEVTTLQEDLLLLIHAPNSSHKIHLESQGEFDYVFNQPGYLLQDLKVLLHCVAHPQQFSLKTSYHETLFAISPDTPATFKSTRGQVISLIPLGGKTSGIKTQGLEWELEEGSLDKNFIGISNVALSDTVSIRLNEGILLCCINHNLNDQELISTKS